MIPLVAPCITKHDRKYMVDRVTDGLLEDESEVRRFEEAFAARVGSEWAVAVCSGTEALRVALPGGQTEPWMPSYSCVAIANAAPNPQKVHLVDSHYDVKSATMTQDEATVTVHMFGNATHVPGPHRAHVEDVTLSLGAEMRTPFIGVCSTHASKMISTGRGGVIFGEANAFEGGFRNKVESHELLGGGSRAMSPMQAALGVSQLGQLDAFIERRRELAAGYTERFRAGGIDCPDSDCGSVFFRYIISVEDPALKVEALAVRGIEAGRGVYPPLHRLAGLPDSDFPGTTAAVESLLSVPVHPSISDAQAGHIIESVLAVCAP